MWFRIFRNWYIQIYDAGRQSAHTHTHTHKNSNKKQNRKNNENTRFLVESR